MAAGDAPGVDGATVVTADGCVEILTGAACPPGTEAVVPGERVRREGDRVVLPAAIEAGENIARPGSECRAGEVVLRPGQTLTPLAAAVLASFGVERVLAVPRPRVGAIVTGAEIVPVGEAPGPGRIRDSNGPMLESLIPRDGSSSPALASPGRR